MEKVNHYNQHQIETIEMMVRIWGHEKTAIFCELNAFKYRMRLGFKGDINEDLKKERYYLEKMNELKNHKK